MCNKQIEDEAEGQRERERESWVETNPGCSASFDDETKQMESLLKLRHNIFF